MSNSLSLGFVACLALTALLALGFAFPVAAHVHPIVPADECASPNANDHPGNNAQPRNGDNGQQFIPGFIPEANPGNADLDHVEAPEAALNNCANGS